MLLTIVSAEKYKTQELHWENTYIVIKRKKNKILL